MKRRSPALLLAAALGLAGCLTDDGDRGVSIDIDPFPRPQGPKILPLDVEQRAHYRFVELDDSGRVLQRLEDLLLHIEKATGDTFTYAFENPSEGYLIRYRDHADRDSAGIQILGTYAGSARFWHPAPVLWLPQSPKPAASWTVGPGRVMETVSLDTPYYTEVLFQGDDAAPVAQGFQKHPAIHLKETAGDVVTHYWLRKGVGILGFQRSARGKLLASGTLKSLFIVTRRP